MTVHLNLNLTFFQKIEFRLHVDIHMVINNTIHGN